jgi:hypothetical protein
MNHWSDGYSIEDRLILLAAERNRESEKLLNNLIVYRTISGECRKMRQELRVLKLQFENRRSDLQVLRTKFDVAAALVGLNSNSPAD